jgi:DNA polymerase sigma
MAPLNVTFVQVDGVVRMCFPGARVAVYGSQPPGLTVKSSDLDLTVTNTPLAIPSKCALSNFP